MKISFVFLWLRRNKFVDPHYPDHITQGIRSHTAHDCEFVCVTDQVSEPTTWKRPQGDIRAFPTISGFSRHQHCKLEMFRPDLGLCERAALTDLDNFVVGNLDDLLAYDGLFGARRTFHPQSRPQPQMSWAQFDASACEFLWERASAMSDAEINAYAPVGAGRGDQLFVHKALAEVGREYDKLDDLFPGQLESWKWGWLQDGAPNARVLFAHGQPKPHQMQWRPDGDVSPEARQHAIDAAQRRRPRP